MNRTDSLAKMVCQMHVPIGDIGTGLYTKTVTTVKEANDHCWIFAEAAIDELPAFNEGNIGEPFVIAHYGSADGGVAMDLTCKVVRKLREKFGQDKPIVVYYQDQATNDFTSVFQIATGQIDVQSGGKNSYFCTEDNIFIAACGVSFYLQCLPPSFVDLAFSATAFHNAMMPPDAKTSSFGLFGDFNPEDIPSRVEQAKGDWETILKHRSVEMKPGASLIVGNLARQDDGSRPSRTSNGASQQKTMHECLKDMKDESVITQAEFENVVFIEYFRSESEHRAPFMDPNSTVVKAGLRLVHTETKFWRCHHQQEWLAHPDQDPKRYAERLTRQYRVWSNSNFLSALSDERTTEDKKKIIDELYQRYQDVVAANPLDHCDDYVYTYVVMKKKEQS